MLPVIAGVVDYLERQRKAKQARRDLSSGITAQHARSMGAPTYGHAAAQGSRRINEDVRQGNMNQLMGYLSAAGKAKPAATPESGGPAPVTKKINAPPMTGQPGLRTGGGGFGAAYDPGADAWKQSTMGPAGPLDMRTPQQKLQDDLDAEEFAGGIPGLGAW